MHKLWVTFARSSLLKVQSMNAVEYGDIIVIRHKSLIGSLW